MEVGDTEDPMTARAADRESGTEPDEEPSDEHPEDLHLRGEIPDRVKHARRPGRLPASTEEGGEHAGHEEARQEEETPCARLLERWTPEVGAITDEGADLLEPGRDPERTVEYVLKRKGHRGDHQPGPNPMYRLHVVQDEHAANLRSSSERVEVRPRLRLTIALSSEQVPLSGLYRWQALVKALRLIALESAWPLMWTVLLRI